MYWRSITGRCVVRYKSLSLGMLECEMASVLARFREEYMLLLSVPNVRVHSKVDISYKSECAWLLTGTVQVHLRSKGWIAIGPFQHVRKFVSWVPWDGSTASTQCYVCVGWTVFECRQSCGWPVPHNGSRRLVYKHDRCCVPYYWRNMICKTMREHELKLVNGSAAHGHGNFSKLTAMLNEIYPTKDKHRCRPTHRHYFVVACPLDRVN